MSSLKDWYRYVDSKARGRADGDGPPGELSEGAPGETAAAARDRTEAPGASNPDQAPSSAGAAAADEEGLDVWSGLFVPRRKPELPPTTGPLKRPAVRLEEIPPQLLAQAPLDSPPAPQFSLPTADIDIPAFDTFISSPVASEPQPPPTAAADPPPAAASVPETTPAPPAASAASPDGAGSAGGQGDALAALRDLLGDPDALARPLESSTAPSSSAAQPAAAPQQRPPEDPEVSPVTSQGEPAMSAIAAAAPPPPSSVDAADAEPSADTAATDAIDVQAASTDEGESATDEGQLPWRSPSQRKGPGRTISSGASGVRAEPLVSRSSEGQPQPFQARASREAGQEEAGTRDASARGSVEPSPRPAPGTEAWERERVERLARTFRETLRALETTLADPGAQGASSPRRSPIVPGSPPIAPSPNAPPVPESPVQAAGEPERPVAAGPAAKEDGADEEAVGSTTALTASAEAEPVPADQSSPAPIEPPSSAAGTEEAALIRERLPQHMAMLLRIPTNEVAQNSYKSPFRETREDLIGRLLDPQLTLEEAARVLGVCPTTVRRYTNRGMLHCHRTPGNQRRFRMSDVLQFLEQYGDRIDRAAEAQQFEEAA